MFKLYARRGSRCRPNGQRRNRLTFHSSGRLRRRLIPALGLMKRLFVVLTILLALAVTSCVQSPRPVDVSLVNLISTPDRYDGKLVLVSGFLHLEFEGDGLYLYQDDFTHSQTKNGLWISFAANTATAAKAFSDSYVVVVGTFHSKNKGHMGLWSGSISDVSRIYLRPPR